MDSNARHTTHKEFNSFSTIGGEPASLPLPFAGRQQPFRLDQWIVQPQSNEIRCVNSGQRRSLEPRLMRLLCLLSAAPQRVFTREELMTHLWPRVIVNDNSLTRAVSELRRHLSGSDTKAPLIDTIPKTGYRLATHARVQDYAEDAPTAAADALSPKGHRGSFRTLRSPGLAAAASLALGTVLMILMQLQPPIQQQAAGIALADINLGSQAAFDALIAERVETSADTGSANNDPNGLVPIGSPTASQPIVSRDGGLFAYIHYNEQGSSLVLGSTQLPSSPVTIFTTEDTLYNLQWSPVNRALLFAQTPRLTPAAFRPRDDQASLVMFDLETFTTRVIDGPASEAGDRTTNEELLPFKLTSLVSRLDWLS